MTYDIIIRKVAIAGASGPIGQAILNELLKSELFEITILTRDSTAYQSLFAPAIKVIQVDYTSLASLTHAVTDQDAVISTISPSAIPVQKLLIDACIQAHVHRFLPSEYSYDFCNATIRQHTGSNAIFAQKQAIETYLQEQATNTALSYTLLFSNPILEPSLQKNLFFNFPSRSATLTPLSKTHPISLTTLPSLSKAIRRILTHPRETANRPIRIKDIDITHQQLLCIAQSLTPNQEWDIQQEESKETTDATSNYERKFNFGGNFERVHNCVFGIKDMSLPELEDLVRVTCSGMEKEKEKEKESSS
ncbi:f29cc46e-d1b6-438c-bcc1-ef24db8c6d4f [Sclerotinia trifoliorum]|uniref:F29cc46e-d1b6-438c-bcc1-ef24db8c6d4f n=1 Tax=Sclerotinia trifoliorum TaxID=28548 RepID=A0A8H2W1L2_9HELO|nr:f29cc46e-d1b6-438c-bcc1-ef24db8c6d4f [Sclerotinia trifoliorum]